MIIRMKKAAAGPNINWPIGSRQIVDDETGQALLDAGAAESLEEPAVTIHVDSQPADDGATVTDTQTTPDDGTTVAAKRKGKSGA
jgi:hypothetical protein